MCAVIWRIFTKDLFYPFAIEMYSLYFLIIPSGATAQIVSIVYKMYIYWITKRRFKYSLSKFKFSNVVF